MGNRRKNKVIAYSTISLDLNSALCYAPELIQIQNIALENCIKSIPQQH